MESFRPGQLERWGLAPSVLQARHPRLVITRIGAFGQTGPYRDYEASGLVLQAMGGPMNATGGAQRPPLRKPGLLEQYTIGGAAAAATMAGLFNARRRGSGSVIDVSSQEVLLSSGDRRASYLTAAFNSGIDAPRGTRSAHRGASTFTGPFKAKDGFVTLYVTNRGFWNRLMNFVGADDPAFRAKYLDRSCWATIETSFGLTSRTGFGVRSWNLSEAKPLGFRLPPRCNSTGCSTIRTFAVVGCTYDLPSRRRTA